MSTVLTADQRKQLKQARTRAAEAQSAYRALVVASMQEWGASFADVSTETGLSTNTLQRWKREQQ